MTISGLNLSMEYETGNHNKWSVFSRKTDFKVSLDNFFVNVTNKMFSYYSGEFSFLSMEPCNNEIVVDMGKFIWNQPWATDEGKGNYDNPHTFQSVIANRYTGTSISVKNVVFDAKVKYSGKFGLVATYLDNGAVRVVISNVSATVAIEQSRVKESAAVLIGHSEPNAYLDVNGFSVTGSFSGQNGAESLILGYTRGTISGIIRNCDFGGAKMTGSYSKCVIGGGWLTADYSDNCTNCAKQMQ